MDSQSGYIIWTSASYLSHTGGYMDSFDYIKICVYIFTFVSSYFNFIEPNLVLCSMLK
ncbi:MAG: hypothetical protein FD177_1824 [Desulfovibrionaceae bacterium]|nr:MAG: hypothetical protein FD177_1824 [Desulfovibrionaceae bacterium]